MLDSQGFPEVPPRALVDRHIAALYAVQKAKARSADSERFSEIAAELEHEVTALRAKPQRSAPSSGSSTAP
jgi:hypothetical protein